MALAISPINSEEPFRIISRFILLSNLNLQKLTPAFELKKYPNDQQQTENITNSIVRNLSIDYRRAANRSVQSDIDINDTDNSKEQDIRELFDSVKKIIDIKLNDTQRNVLWLRDYEGYSFEEIAKKTGWTEANVRQILSRARKVIRETYKTIN